MCTILKLVAALAAEAELGALFLNAQEAKIMRLILIELGHPQPASSKIQSNDNNQVLWKWDIFGH